MDSTIKNLIMFTLGAAIGTFVTYKVLKQKYEDIAQEEIDSVREYFEQKENAVEKVQVKELVDEFTAQEKQDYTQFASKYTSDAKKVSLEEAAKKYHSSDLAPTDDDPEEEISEEDYGEYERIAREQHVRSFTEPYVITQEAFNDEAPEYDKITITYFAEDDTLIDDGEDIISTVDHIGSEAIYCFGEGSDDEDIVYVRNERLGTDFEVIRNPRSYSEIILGVTGKEPGLDGK